MFHHYNETQTGIQAGKCCINFSFALKLKDYMDDIHTFLQNLKSKITLLIEHLRTPSRLFLTN